MRLANYVVLCQRCSSDVLTIIGFLSCGQEAGCRAAYGLLVILLFIALIVFDAVAIMVVLLLLIQTLTAGKGLGLFCGDRVAV